MFISNFIGGGIVLLFGIALRFFNASGVLAGYNTMNEYEKKKWNERALTRFYGNLFLIEAVLLIFGGILVMLNIKAQAIMIISWCVFILLHFAGVIYVNIGTRFKQI